MHIQIEITTYCNYHCFYCAGRDMEQRHMDIDLFRDILRNRLPPGRHRVSLQGEGEPMMHPSFWDMVKEVADLGHTPYIITNGSLLDVAKVVKLLPRIGISIDTLDAEEAQRIQRHKLHKVLKNLEALLKLYEPWRIVIHTVNYGQELGPLKQYLEKLGIDKHVIQGLQTKDDYAYRYQDQVPVTFHKQTYTCAFIESPVMRFFNLDGVEMPCCYIKDVSKYTSIEEIRETLGRKVVPAVCIGCRELQEGESSMARVFQVI